jgi:hypothetical protein
VRRLTTILLLAALVGALGACGDDSDSGDSADTSSRDVEGFAKALSGSTDGAITKADSRCVADAAVPDLSAAGRKAMATEKAEGPEGLSKADRKVLFSAFDQCIDTKTLAQAMATAMGAGGDGTFSSATLDCVVDKLTADHPSSGALMESILSDKSETALTATLTACVSPDDIEAQLVQEFTSQGLTDAQARCVAAKVSAAIPPDQLIALGTGGQDLPAEMQQTITEAATSCMAAG